MPGTRAGYQLRVSSSAGSVHESGGIAAASHLSDSRITSCPSIRIRDLREIDPFRSGDEFIESSHCLIPGRSERRDGWLGLEGPPARQSEG